MMYNTKICIQLSHKVLRHTVDNYLKPKLILQSSNGLGVNTSDIMLKIYKKKNKKQKTQIKNVIITTIIKPLTNITVGGGDLAPTSSGHQPKMCHLVQNDRKTKFFVHLTSATPLDIGLEVLPK